MPVRAVSAIGGEVTHANLDEINRTLGDHGARLENVERHVFAATEKDGCLRRLDNCERLVRGIFLCLRFGIFFVVVAVSIAVGIAICIAEVIAKTAPFAGTNVAHAIIDIVRCLR